MVINKNPLNHSSSIKLCNFPIEKQPMQKLWKAIEPFCFFYLWTHLEEI